MPTNIRGRSGTRTRSQYGNVTGYSTRSGWGQSGTGTKRSGTTSRKNTPSAYKNVCTDFQYKINSYKTLYNQTWGPAKYDRPTTTILNNFANWVNKGAIVHTVSCAQIAKWARTTNTNFNTRNATITGCRNVLYNKFGKSTIKAVARTKTGSFMVATMPTWKGRPFTFPR